MQEGDYSNYRAAINDEPLNLGPNIFIILWNVVKLIKFVALIIIEIWPKRPWMKIEEEEGYEKSFLELSQASK